MRESKAAVFWVVMLAVVVVGIWWFVSQQDTEEPRSPYPNGAQEVTVHFLKDGDSLEVAALAPGSVIATTDPVQVRLLGIDAPEMHGADGLPQCWAESAKAELQKLAPHGGRLWVIGDVQKQDNYGRYLLYAWTPKGIFINETLGGTGSVRELYIRPNERYQPEIATKIDEARRAKRGLWGQCI